jgi:hypothetical protein
VLVPTRPPDKLFIQSAFKARTLQRRENLWRATNVERKKRAVQNGRLHSAEFATDVRRKPVEHFLFGPLGIIAFAHTEPIGIELRRAIG